MKNKIQRLSILALGLTGGIVIGSQTSLAQQQEPVPPLQHFSSPSTVNDEGFQRNERSSSGIDSLGSGFNPINLIHNVNLRRGRGGGEFAEDTQNSLDKAAQEFKRQQQLQLQQAPNSLTPSAQP